MTEQPLKVHTQRIGECQVCGTTLWIATFELANTGKWIVICQSGHRNQYTRWVEDGKQRLDMTIFAETELPKSDETWLDAFPLARGTTCRSLRVE